jgi:probable O-glycosylation ligase (exosortase A-associated)
MARDIVLSLAFLWCLRLSFQYPYAGVLAWTWLTIMQPNREVYGAVSTSLRLNFMVAAVTIFTWYLSKERKLPRADATFVVGTIFFVWVTFNSFFVPFPDVSAEGWDRFWKVLALGLMVMLMANSRLRINALIWVTVVSLCYYGVKGGALTIMTGGSKNISGPAGTNIGDNNQLALSLLMVTPLIYYLWLHAANRWVRRGLTVGGLLTFLSVMGSYSRGAYLSLVALAVLGWLRVPGMRAKLLYPILAVLVAYPVLEFMPPSFYARLNTLNSLNNDMSFQGRLTAWRVAYDVAIDRFPMGAGFQGAEQESLYHSYFPREPNHAAHSIYFQVLGDHGFPGLAMYLVILVLGFANTRKIRKLTRGRPELAWAHNLASMIQISLFVFCVGGSSLSQAYYDVPWIWWGLLPALKNLVQQTERQQAIAQAPGAVPSLASVERALVPGSRVAAWRS